MKNKKRGILVILILFIILASLYFGFFHNSKKNVQAAKVINTIEKFDYHLYDNQTTEYKKLFAELEKILQKEEIDYDQYVEVISKMFIIDYYTLENKATNLNIGGVDFVYSEIVENFKSKSKDTLYKYVESNIEGERKQELPAVKEVNIDSKEQKNFTYQDQIDRGAYFVTVSWSYEKDLGYDQNKTLIFIHENDKLSLVEMS